MKNKFDLFNDTISKIVIYAIKNCILSNYYNYIII